MASGRMVLRAGTRGSRRMKLSVFEVSSIALMLMAGGGLWAMVRALERGDFVSGLLVALVTLFFLKASTDVARVAGYASRGER